MANSPLRSDWSSLELASISLEVSVPSSVQVIVTVNGPDVNSVTLVPLAEPAVFTTPFVPIWLPPPPPPR